MVDTTYPRSGQGARLATVHQREATGLVENPNPPTYTPDVRGDGGLVSTASDYSAFVQMLLNEGSWHGKRLLKPETVRLMTSNQIGSVVVDTMPAAIPSAIRLVSVRSRQGQVRPGFPDHHDRRRTHARARRRKLHLGGDQQHAFLGGSEKRHRRRDSHAGAAVLQRRQHGRHEAVREIDLRAPNATVIDVSVTT